VPQTTSAHLPGNKPGSALGRLSGDAYSRPTIGRKFIVVFFLEEKWGLYFSDMTDGMPGIDLLSGLKFRTNRLFPVNSKRRIKMLFVIETMTGGVYSR